jgi:hypothetical protein
MLSAGTMVQIVKDEHWQRVRKTLLGQWKLRPEWCCMQLYKYLGGISTAPDAKIVILMNYLVGHAFRLRKIDFICVNKLRFLLKKEREKRKKQGTWKLKMIPKNR